MVHLADALALERDLADLEFDLSRSPLSAIAWLPGQLSWLSDPGPAPKLLRTGVRGGKTLAAVQEVFGRATGAHPFLVGLPPPPVKIAVVTTDKQAQGLAIQRLFWELCPRHLLIPGIEFSNRTGFRGHVPVVEFINGSTITFFSGNAGPQAIQGGEFHYVHIDEPCSEEMYVECRNRTRNTGGTVGITLTPLNQRVPYLQELVSLGHVTDHHFRLTVSNQTSPMTGLVRKTKAGVPWDEEFIAAWRTELADSPVTGVVLDGDWEMRSEGQWFACWDGTRHVSDVLPSGVLPLFLGIDYATAEREYGMCAVLSTVTQRKVRGSLEPHVHALDEVVMPGTATMQQFAAAIIAMLQRNGLKWGDLDEVYGDIPARSKHETACNLDLSRCLARALNLAHERMLPAKIKNAKKGGASSGRDRRSKDIRCTWMYDLIAHDQVRVHSRCAHLRLALETWDYGDRHEAKDVLDAWMYGLIKWWIRSKPTRFPKVLVG